MAENRKRKVQLVSKLTLCNSTRLHGIMNSLRSNPFPMPVEMESSLFISTTTSCLSANPDKNRIHRMGRVWRGQSLGVAQSCGTGHLLINLTDKRVLYWSLTGQFVPSKHHAQRSGQLHVHDACVHNAKHFFMSAAETMTTTISSIQLDTIEGILGGCIQQPIEKNIEIPFTSSCGDGSGSGMRALLIGNGQAKVFVLSIRESVTTKTALFLARTDNQLNYEAVTLAPWKHHD